MSELAASWSVSVVERTGPRRLAWGLYRFARYKPLGFAGLVILFVFTFGAVFAPLLTEYRYDQANFRGQLQSPSREHILGTDSLGRDMFSRILYGTRVSLGVSLAAMAIGKSLGVLLAVVSGYYGGWLDKILQRFIDVWLALPSLIILVSLVGLIGPSIGSMILVLGLTSVPWSARLFRSGVVQVMGRTFVEAGRAVGVTDVRLMWRYVVPNIMPLVIYSATVTLGLNILIIASLGFLGFGLPPPHPDLGSMLSGAGLTYMRRTPWLAIWPGLAITLIAFGFNVFGDAIRDVLDPRLRGAR
jgi:peptide/nickel transport system permease protein